MAEQETAHDRPDHADIDALLGAVVDRRCRESFRRLHDRTSSRLFGVICRINSDRQESEDLLQETYLKAWNQCGQYDRARAPAIFWLSGIARNHALSSVRRRSARRVVSLDTADDPDPYGRIASSLPGPESSLVVLELRREVDGFLASLPPTERACLALSLSGRLTQVEIADRLGAPLGTVKSWVRRSNRRLQAALTDHR